MTIGIAINPGSGPVPNATAVQAAAAMEQFVRDLAERGITVNSCTRNEADDYDAEHHDGHLDDGTKAEPKVIWHGYGRLVWTDEQHDMIPATAQWLRNDLPRLAATLVGTSGLSIDDADEDQRAEFLPEDVEEILTAHFLLDADGQTSYWRPEDKDRATYGALIYKDTAAATFLHAWIAFVDRWHNVDGQLRSGLELTAARLERPGTDLVADLTKKPTEIQAVTLKELMAALGERDSISAKLTRADERVANAVRACLGAKVSAIELATRLDVTRARIYQIRDGRR